MHKFQNKSARAISNVLPGGSIVLPPEKAERLRASAAFKSGDMIELGDESAPEQPMPKPRIPNLTKAKEDVAIGMIRDMSNVEILEAWWKAENAAPKPRERILDEIRLRAQAIAPKGSVA